jgi:hypothetical protein
MMGTILVFSLIDNGITHNFINLTLLNEKNYQVVSTNPMIVIVDNGARIVTYSKCEALHFTI